MSATSQENCSSRMQKTKRQSRLICVLPGQKPEDRLSGNGAQMIVTVN